VSRTELQALRCLAAPNHSMPIAIDVDTWRALKSRGLVALANHGRSARITPAGRERLRHLEEQDSGAEDGPRKTIRSVRTDDDGRETTMPQLPTGTGASLTNQVESKSVNAANRAPPSASRLPPGLYRYETTEGTVYSHARGAE
jgi:hypothetical protein